MIEPTAEMIAAHETARRAYWRALDHDTGIGGMTAAEHERVAQRQAMAAVLAIVERDYRLVRVCGAELGTTLRCERAEHDQGKHEAIAAGGSLVRWS